MSDHATQAGRWYHSRRWARRSRLHKEASPLCVACAAEDRVEPATDCDHVTPHHGDPYAFWNGPLQSLCRIHHNAKTQAERGQRSRPAIGLDGYPISASDPPEMVRRVRAHDVDEDGAGITRQVGRRRQPVHTGEVRREVQAGGAAARHPDKPFRCRRG